VISSEESYNNNRKKSLIKVEGIINSGSTINMKESYISLSQSIMERSKNKHDCTIWKVDCTV
jgi:hypothetical protein